ncbi:MAG: glutathionylspermidine synthase family protein [Fimbriimonas sp.]
MQRIPIAARPDWRPKVEALGLLFHTTPDGAEGTPYWFEDAYYRLTEREVETLERATNELHEMCLAAVQHVIDRDRFGEMGIPAEAVPAIKWAWEAEPPSIYGRFDLAYDGVKPPKLLEYNADTPTALLEAAVVQWHWLQERFPDADQFNSIWEGLVELWKELRRDRHLKGAMVHFAHVETLEDLMTTTLMRDTAQEAGLVTDGLHMKDIGWDDRGRHFVDLQDRRIWTIFKLYPWEWMLKEEFAKPLLASYEETQWIEPIWKTILSNKAILAILWEMYPEHPYLLPAYLGGARHMKDYVRKPLLSREGANVMVKQGGTLTRTDGAYGQEGYVFQEYFPLPEFDGSRPVIGSWVIDGTARGIGIRESDGLVTDNFSRFVPHLF